MPTQRRGAVVARPPAPSKPLALGEQTRGTQLDNRAKARGEGDDPGSGVGRRFIRIGTAARRLGVSRSTLYLWVARGRLPAPVRIGPQTAGYFEDVLDSWLDARAAESREVRA